MGVSDSRVGESVSDVVGRLVVGLADDDAGLSVIGFPEGVLVGIAVGGGVAVGDFVDVGLDDEGGGGETAVGLDDVGLSVVGVADDGALVGIDVGNDDGGLVGLKDGVFVGVVVGERVEGVDVGMDVGDFVGLAVGLEDVGLSVVGFSDGGLVGDAVGENEGDLVGLLVIGFDEVGLFVVGCCDGSAVGTDVGIFVGLDVATDVPVSLNVPPTTVAF